MYEELAEYLRRDPFEPFSVLTTSGNKYTVKDELATALTKVALHIYPPKLGHVVIPLDQIAAVEAVIKSTR